MLKSILLTLVLFLITAVAFADHYPVERVVDGDTARVTLPSGSESVRFIGIAAPETVHPRIPPQPYGPEATALARQLLDGQQVQLQIGVQERDQFGRLLAHIFLPDGQHVNLLIAEAGLARLDLRPPNTEYAEVLTAAVQGARSVNKGMWADEPQPFRDRNCADFRTHDQAQAFFRGAAPGDRHRLDSDGDGVACAALPHGRSSR